MLLYDSEDYVSSVKVKVTVTLKVVECTGTSQSAVVELSGIGSIIQAL